MDRFHWMFMRQVLSFPPLRTLLGALPRWLHVPPKIAPWRRVLPPAIVSTTISNNLKIYIKGVGGGWFPSSLSDTADSYRKLGCVFECQFLFVRRPTCSKVIRRSRCSTTCTKKEWRLFTSHGSGRACRTRWQLRSWWKDTPDFFFVRAHPFSPHSNSDDKGCGDSGLILDLFIGDNIIDDTLYCSLRIFSGLK